jgi:uncharacterized protein DUF4386
VNGALTTSDARPERSSTTRSSTTLTNILGAGDDTRVTLDALLEIFLMIGNVGTAVAMFPILRRYSETLSLSYVASRTIEATIIGVGAISLLSIVTLRDDLAASIGADRTSLASA